MTQGITAGVGVTIIDPNKKPEATAFVADRRLGRTADRTRVVDYYSTEAAFGFKAPGQKVTTAEAAQFGISAEHPFSPTPGETRAAEPAVESKAVEKPEDKAITRAEVENKSVTKRKKKGK